MGDNGSFQGLSCSFMSYEGGTKCHFVLYSLSKAIYIEKQRAGLLTIQNNKENVSRWGKEKVLL